MANLIRVKKGKEPTRAFWHVDDAHPGGEAFVAGNNVVRVARTAAVMAALGEGLLVEVTSKKDEEEEAPTDSEPALIQPAGTAQDAPGGSLVPSEGSGSAPAPAGSLEAPAQPGDAAGGVPSLPPAAVPSHGVDDVPPSVPDGPPPVTVDAPPTPEPPAPIQPRRGGRFVKKP